MPRSLKIPLEEFGTVLERSRRTLHTITVAFNMPGRRGLCASSDAVPISHPPLQVGWFCASSDAGCSLGEGRETCGG
ncbi:hypothetical protein V6N11_075135 [Hibiscus sabdariffa]|uniref:Uncharacterized protein n=1 Tax=Hibiscus sabdariffa TaxID=183260 RepID=A0ABR2R5M0_9ROSI